MASCSKKDLQDQQNFEIDVMIDYLYYDIVFDRLGKNTLSQCLS